MFKMIACPNPKAIDFTPGAWLGRHEQGNCM